jgi:hypothetical protein
MPSKTAIHTSVVAAFFDSGGLKAGIPLLIASVPVMAEHPLANARSTRNARRIPVAPAWVGSGRVPMGGGDTAKPGVVARRNNPTPISVNAEPTNTYVGRAKSIPDSRVPRRFARATPATTTTAMATR